MQQFTLRIFVVVITFFIGIVAVYVCLVKHQNKFEYQLVKIPTTIEKRISPIESNPILTRNEEYAVYSAILNNQYSNKMVIISDYTWQAPAKDVEDFKQEMDGLAEDTIDNFKTKNTAIVKLENIFAFNGKSALISKEEKKRVYRNGQDGWIKLRRKYPKLSNKIDFSAIGFNYDQTQALVRVTMNCSWYSGNSSLILLQKENGKWIIRKTLNVVLYY